MMLGDKELKDLGLHHLADGHPRENHEENNLHFLQGQQARSWIT